MAFTQSKDAGASTGTGHDAAPRRPRDEQGREERVKTRSLGFGNSREGE